MAQNWIVRFLRPCASGTWAARHERRKVCPEHDAPCKPRNVFLFRAPHTDDIRSCRVVEDLEVNGFGPRFLWQRDGAYEFNSCGSSIEVA